MDNIRAVSADKHHQQRLASGELLERYHLSIQYVWQRERGRSPTQFCHRRKCRSHTHLNIHRNSRTSPKKRVSASAKLLGLFKQRSHVGLGGFLRADNHDSGEFSIAVEIAVKRHVNDHTSLVLRGMHEAKNSLPIPV